MKKYSKKIALILVLALTLAVAIPVLAATDYETVINSKYQDPTIDVVLTTGTVDAIINPYGLPMDLLADDQATPIGKLKNAQIVSATPLVGYSLSEVDLNVGATVVGEEVGDFKLATTKPATTETKKLGLVYLEAKTVSDLGYVTGTDTTTQIGQLTGAKVLSELNGWTKKDYKANNKDQIIVGTKEATQSQLCTLKAAMVGETKQDAPVSNGYLLARLSGDVVKAPKDDWVAADGVKVTISWTFEPSTGSN